MFKAKINLINTTGKMLFLVMLLFSTLSISTNTVSATSDPGCYKIANGQPEKLDCPTSNAVYDDGTGGNLSGPITGKCYIYSANLYEGDASWGEPYVQVDCANMKTCPDNQELRYSENKAGAPECVGTDVVADGTYAGGAQPPETSGGTAIRANPNGFDENGNPIEAEGDYYCGAEDGKPTVKISFDIGCLNTAYGRDINPILDMAFALLRIVSAGVGMVVAGSIVWAGIQYATSRGDPKATESSRKRITNAVIALLIYIFSYAILNFIVPGGLFI